jgi:hypothetical protein
MTTTEILLKQRGLIEDLQQMNSVSTPNPRRDQIATDLLETNELLTATTSPATPEVTEKIVAPKAAPTKSVATQDPDTK